MSPVERTALMSQIRSKDPKPELIACSIVHRLGYRFRLHRKDLSGRPDIVLLRHRKIILVQGCFWHGHTCKLASKPKANSSYWAGKIAGNSARDARTIALLRDAGWQVMDVWECDVRKAVGLEENSSAF